MHVSWGKKSSREPLWTFAKKHSLVGLDFRCIDRRWEDVSNAKRMSLTQTWRYHFEQFSSLEEGECVMVANGQTDVLGVGLVKGPYQYKSELEDFFRHVRKVQWLVGYDWDRRKPVRIPGFRNTILRVGEGSPFWRLANLRLPNRRRIPLNVRERGIRMHRELLRKYGPSGEGYEHKRLKQWVLDHSESVARSPILRHHEEYRFESGDRADIVFDLPGKRYCVVEIETDVPTPGAHQALKYRTLKCAQLWADVTSASVEAVLVAEKAPENMDFCRRYGIRFVKKTFR
jgi:hypothetical protein